MHFPPVQGFLTGKKYSYCIVGPDDVEKANFLLYDTYHPDEPITKHLGLTQGGQRIPDADRMVQDIVPTHLSMSVIMIHRDFPCFAFFLLFHVF